MLRLLSPHPTAATHHIRSCMTKLLATVFTAVLTPVLNRVRSTSSNDPDAHREWKCGLLPMHSSALGTLVLVFGPCWRGTRNLRHALSSRRVHAGRFQCSILGRAARCNEAIRLTSSDMIERGDMPSASSASSMRCASDASSSATRGPPLVLPSPPKAVGKLTFGSFPVAFASSTASEPEGAGPAPSYSCHVLNLACLAAAYLLVAITYCTSARHVNEVMCAAMKPHGSARSN